MNEFQRNMPFRTAEEFLSYLSPVSNAIWRERNHVFRGQMDMSLPLTPSAHRMGTDVSVSTFYGEHDVTIGEQVAFEKAVLLRFLEACDHAGLQVPDDSEALRRSLKQFDRSRSGNYNWPTAEFHRVLAFAQHHGVPTCLLDWSRNPFVASYFAASSVLTWKLTEANCSARMAVWVLDTRCQAINVIEAPGGTSPYLAAQSGLFTVSMIKNESETLESFYETRLDEDLSPGHTDPEPLQCVSLPASEASEVLHILSLMGITGAKLFPGYEGVSRDVKDWARARRLSAGPVENSHRYEINQFI
ncbi:FRG domain-containing protein [Salinicola sp. JS01]|uniref:FRG domain-containing protein n=1 Tax=Salinicola sp. JS01 TaxID=3050071 RepID=UPI00255B6ADD|nr:FRG domain-containing protein [Salinicola sp. JS01]WIX33270.1 FRG domain-containing protein [Salinicola sp. JS01]